MHCNPTAALQSSIVELFVYYSFSSHHPWKQRAAYFVLPAWLAVLKLIALPIILNKKLHEVNHSKSCLKCTFHIYCSSVASPVHNRTLWKWSAEGEVEKMLKSLKKKLADLQLGFLSKLDFDLVSLGFNVDLNKKRVCICRCWPWIWNDDGFRRFCSCQLTFYSLIFKNLEKLSERYILHNTQFIWGQHSHQLMSYVERMWHHW